jgi:hypothetical protein
MIPYDMPSFHFDHPLSWCLWNLLALVAVVPYHSIFEWSFHRWVMHKRLRWFKLPYELHAVTHHGLFGADHTYHAQDENMRSHITFEARDYIFLTLLNLPVYVGVELLTSKPILVGCVLSCLFYLQAFNSIHWRMHVPSDTWFQRSWVFKFLKRHHLLHHEHNFSNLNVVCPLGDFLFRTLVTKPRNPEKLLQV